MSSLQIPRVAIRLCETGALGSDEPAASCDYAGSHGCGPWGTTDCVPLGQEKGSVTWANHACAHDGYVSPMAPEEEEVGSSLNAIVEDNNCRRARHDQGCAGRMQPMSTRG